MKELNIYYHALIENSIGKAKQIIKQQKKPVPISAYDAFSALVDCGVMNVAELKKWNTIIGLATVLYTTI